MWKSTFNAASARYDRLYMDNLYANVVIYVFNLGRYPDHIVVFDIMLFTLSLWLSLVATPNFTRAVLANNLASNHDLGASNLVGALEETVSSVNVICPLL